jgi:hypothetical protein
VHEVARKSWVVPACGGVVLLALVAFVYRDAFSAGFVDDDFSLLALARMLDNPLWLFVRNHMLSMPYFRPVGVAFWWLAEHAFGPDAAAQYLVNLMLHAGVALALWRFIATSTCCGRLGFAAALVFALHPLAIGTSLWLSDRFDLLATLFGLLALHAAWRFRCDAGARAASASLAWLLLALLSKEVAVALAPALALVWLWPAPEGHRGNRRHAAAWLLLPIVGTLLVRWYVLGEVGAGGLLADRSPWDVMVEGIASWFASWPGAVTFFRWLEPREVICTGIGAISLFACLVRNRRSPFDRQRGLVPLLGAVLLLAPALVQWPMIGVLPVRAIDPAHVMESASDSRYYYLSLCGLLVLLAGLLAPQRDAAPQRAPLAAIAGMLLLGAALAATSQRLVRAWRAHTAPLVALVDSANRAIAGLPLPQPACQIYLLGAPDPTLGHYADDVVKATYPVLGDVANCLVQTEHTPWHHLVPHGRVAAAQLAPLLPLRNAGEVVAWPRIGNVDIAYLNLADGPVAAHLDHAWFLEWRDGEFVDISDAVRSGRRNVVLHCNRAPQQCP